jgi:hypothetical protein
MRYIQPKITKTVAATFAIQSTKGGPQSELTTHIPTTGPAYQSDE